MKRFTITFTIITFIFGCTILPKDYIIYGYNYRNNDKSVLCQDLYKDIAEKWGYHKGFNSCYYLNENLISIITKEKDCFIGLSGVEIKKIFGEPSMTTKNHFSYTVSKQCSEIDTLFSSKSIKFKVVNSEITDVKFQEADVHY